MKQNVIFHLGRNIMLSLAEISLAFSDSIYGAELFNNEILIMQVNMSNADIINICKNCGGIKKVSQPAKTLPMGLSEITLQKEIADIAINESITRKRKLNLGINTYGFVMSLKSIGMEIKKILKSRQINVRVVENEDENKNLNSVSIMKNGLLKDKGLDINIIQTDQNIIISKTLFCQNSMSYSKRDYGRPRRNAKVGMMPPKLAQILLNLAKLKKGDVFLDPFAGLGTIVQEGALADYNSKCSDISSKNLSDLKSNLEWLKKVYPWSTKYLDEKNIKESDAIKIHETFRGDTFDGIITEGTLGPPLSYKPSKEDALKIIEDLIAIYKIFFSVSAPKILKKNARIVITLPVIRIKDNSLIYSSDYILKHIDKNLKQCDLLNKDLINRFSLLQSNSSRFIYHRKNQIVTRELIVLEKIS